MLRNNSVTISNVQEIIATIILASKIMDNPGQVLYKSQAIKKILQVKKRS